MNNSKILRIGLPVAGALAVALAAIAVTASAAGVSLTRTSSPAAATKPSTPNGTTTSPEVNVKADIAAYCATFTKNFAADLHVTQDAVDAAAKKAFGQTVDQAVTDGKLTAEQATKLKAAVPSGSLCTAAAAALPPGRGGFGAPGGPGGPGGRMGAGQLGPYMSAYTDAAAKAAGLKSADELQKAMASGQSLATIAKNNGVDEKTFRSNLITNLTPTLDAAVAAGKLTADQEKAILAKLQTGPIPLWKGHPMGPKGTPPSGAPVPPAA